MTNDNAQKTPFASSLHRGIEHRAKAQDATVPKAMPVTIKSINSNQTAVDLTYDTDPTTFTMPPTTVPLWINRYLRFPYAVGDKGYAVPGSLGVTPADKLGPAVSTFTKPSNLSTLVFHPIADTVNFPAMTDPNAAEMTAPNGHLFHDDALKSLLKVHPSGTSISSGGNSASTPGPQNFQAHDSGDTEHNATQNHTATVGQTNQSTADKHKHISTTSHTITAPMIGLDGDTSVSGTFSPSGGMAAGSVSAGALAPGAASTNIGTLGGDLAGTLPNPTVVGLTHVVHADTIPTYGSNALALANGLVAGQLYLNNTIDSSNTVLCVVT